MYEEKHTCQVWIHLYTQMIFLVGWFRVFGFDTKLGLVFNNCGIVNNISIEACRWQCPKLDRSMGKYYYSNIICCSLFANVWIWIALVVHCVHDTLFFVLCISKLYESISNIIPMLIHTQHEYKVTKKVAYQNPIKKWNSFNT
jgi:hypothetical protein